MPVPVPSNTKHSPRKVFKFEMTDLATEIRHPISALIHPTWACNLHCLYCYSGKSDVFGKMSAYVLRNTLFQLAEHNHKFQRTKIIWHGGEPTLMGQEFFETVLQIQNEFGERHTFVNLLQTNCTAISPRFMDFLIKNKFNVGTSLDGNKSLHDSQRVNKAGEGTHESVASTIEYFRSHGCSVNSLAVMTANTLKNLDEFYEFIRSQSEYSIKINPLIYAGYACDHNNLSISPEQYGHAMIYLFDRWIDEEEGHFNIEPLAEMLIALTSGNVKTCAFSGNCLDFFIGIDYSGNITPCGKWAESDFCLGNINDTTLSQALQSPNAKLFREKREIALGLCKGCKYLHICNGGCPHNSYMINQDITVKDFYCEAYRIIFQHIEKVVQKEISYVQETRN